MHVNLWISCPLITSVVSRIWSVLRQEAEPLYTDTISYNADDAPFVYYVPACGCGSVFLVGSGSLHRTWSSKLKKNVPGLGQYLQFDMPVHLLLYKIDEHKQTQTHAHTQNMLSIEY